MATRGSCTFAELCNGSAQSYACDNVIDITRKGDGQTPTACEAEQMLVKHLDSCIQKIERGRGRRLEKFYIGKTLVKQKEGTRFDHMKRTTWKLDGGISDRWSKHKDDGCDGLIVLTVVTKGAIHPAIQSNNPKFCKSEEKYALALESRLILDYMTDPRLQNESLEPGKRGSSSESVGYPLYIVFTVKEEETPSPGQSSVEESSQVQSSPGDSIPDSGQSPEESSPEDLSTGESSTTVLSPEDSSVYNALQASFVELTV